MNKMRKDATLKILFLALGLTCFCAGTLMLALVIAIFNAWALIVTILLYTGFVIFWRLAYLKRWGYQLKYYFCNNKYNKEIVDVLAKFQGAPQDFIDELKHDTKTRYRYAGYLFSRDSIDDLYKDKRAKYIILDLYTKLYNSIENQKGFVDFFKQIEDIDLDRWEIDNYMSNDMISNELHYLLMKVYMISRYTIYDNGLSEKFTEKNNKLINDLNNIYSPLLFNFKDEIKKIINKLQNN